MPPLRTVQREVQKLDAITRRKGRDGPRELRRYRPHVVRSTDNLWPADVYTADGHRSDEEVQHPLHGRPFRPEIVSVVDCATRRCIGWSAGLDESAWLVADALRHASGAGIPAIFYVDRGSGFINKHLGAEAVGVLARLGTEMRVSLPYNSQARGLIERFHKSCHVRMARLGPNFVGADMDKEARQRAFKRSRREIAETGATRVLPSWDRFLEQLASRIAHYNARPHSGLPKVTDPESGQRRHMSPDEAWAAAEAQGWEPIVPTPAEMEDLFRPYEIRKVRRGTVSLLNKQYFSQALEPYHEAQVRVGYDIHDPATVVVRDVQGRLICLAGLDANRRDMFPQSEVERSRERRAKGQLGRTAKREEEILAQLQSDKVVALHPVEPEIDPATEAARQRIEAELAQPAAAAPDPEDESRQRFARALKVEAALEAGEEPAAADMAWLERYRKTAEYRSTKRMIEDFGESYLLTWMQGVSA